MAASAPPAVVAQAVPVAPPPPVAEVKPNPAPAVLVVGSPVSPPAFMLNVVQAFPPAERPRALRTAFCESGWHTTARGLAGEVGLWQVSPVHLNDKGVVAVLAAADLPPTIASLEDPWGNALVAAFLLERRPGWPDWINTRDGCAGWY